MGQPPDHDSKYAGAEYYWGKEPSELALRVLEFVRPRADFRPRVIDLGCGEGRDVVCFATQGFDATGLEISGAGIEKAQRLAREKGVAIKTIQADVNACVLEGEFDVMYSNGTLQYLPPLPPELRAERFAYFKAQTAPGGVHVFSVFVEKPFIARAPDAGEDEYPYRSGELALHYWDWEILECGEKIFECNSSGVPHRHAMNVVVARRPVRACEIRR